MKQIYVEPKLEIIEISNDEIITTSNDRDCAVNSLDFNQFNF